MSRSVALLVALVAALALPAVASGARLPADARVVAGPSASGIRVFAWVRGDALCMEARGGLARADEHDDAGDDCEPRLALTPLGHDTRGPLAADVPRYAYGVAGADVAAATLNRGDRVLGRAPTGTGTGSLAGLRFFLVEAPSGRPNELRLLDAAGVARRAEDLSIFTPWSPFLRPAGARTLAHGRRATVPWSLFGYERSALAATPLEPLRRVQRTCLRLRVGRFDGPGDLCDAQLQPGQPPAVSHWSGCGAIGAAATVLAGWRMRRLLAVLTDGRRREGIVVRPRRADAALLTAGVVLAGRGAGIRRVEAYDGTGHLVATEPLSLAPRSGGCSSAVAELVLLRRLPDHAGESAPPGDLVAADGPDAALCLDVGALVVTRLTCALPPVEPKDVQLSTRVAAGRRVVFGAVPMEVAGARIILDDGTKVPATSAPLPITYAGRYRDVARVVRVDVAAERHAVAFDLLDPSGAVLAQSPGPELPPLTHRARLARGPGGAVLEAGVRAYPEGRGYRTSCVGTGLDRDAACPLAIRGTFLARVPCGSRRLVIAGWTPRAGDRLWLEAATGGRIPARMGRLPSAVGRGAGALIVAGPRVTARRLLLRTGGRLRRIPLRLPPPREQCGYTTGGLLPSGRAPWTAFTAAASAASSGSATRSAHGARSAADG